MRIYAVSDLHVNYPENKRWVTCISQQDYKNDVLIVAGDISDLLTDLEWCLTLLAMRFQRVLYVPGNHDLWVCRTPFINDSLEKFRRVCSVARNCNVATEPTFCDGVLIVPLLSWYDYSFGEATDDLVSIWTDYHACVWPWPATSSSVAEHFLSLNAFVSRQYEGTIMTFSHFVPRLDLLPTSRNRMAQLLRPVMGTGVLEDQIRQTGASIHVYGHSHINAKQTLDGVTYLNNSLGYPSETYCSRQLRCLHCS